jgi:hypothetical protein
MGPATPSFPEVTGRGETVIGDHGATMAQCLIRDDRPAARVKLAISAALDRVSSKTALIHRLGGAFDQYPNRFLPGQSRRLLFRDPIVQYVQSRRGKPKSDQPTACAVREFPSAIRVFRWQV